MKPTNHPSEAQLALYAGGDLGFWEQRRLRGHISVCAQCEQEIGAIRSGSEELRKAAANLPQDVNWSRLSQEMSGNIRVGLAAGECIDGFEKVIRTSKPHLAWHSALILACATLVVVAALWVSLPRQQLDHLASALGQIRWERIGTTWRTPAAGQDTVVLESSPSLIEVKSHGNALSLLHPRSEGPTVSLNMQDSAGVRYVDADTGQVTINKVYYAQ